MRLSFAQKMPTTQHVSHKMTMTKKPDVARHVDHENIAGSVETCTMSNMNVLFSTHTSPTYMPPLAVSNRQIIIGPKYQNYAEGGLVKSISVATERYDLAAVVSSIPEAQRPELLLVLVDSYQRCVPENLRAVPGRKVLLVADTHHGRNPLRTAMAYARQEPFDRIVILHDPHHLHWFAEADIAPTKYIPNVSCQMFAHDFVESREPAIVFVGQVGQLHPRRQYMLEAIKRSGLPLVVRQAVAPAAARIYGSTQISFNCSLNGDLNMRVFEVLGAGGFLITDRLSPQAGLEKLFHRGEEYVDYQTVDDLLGQLRHYLAHPDECIEIAKAGQTAYLKAHQPAQRVRDLLDFAFSPSTGPSCKYDDRADQAGGDFGNNLQERMAFYEFFQQLSLKAERIVVGVDPALGPRVIADLVDLPRLKIQVWPTTNSSSRLKESLRELGSLEQVVFQDATPLKCDIQLTDLRTLSKSRDSISIRPQLLGIIMNGRSNDNLLRWLPSQGYFRISENPCLFDRTHSM
jgi:Glycosyl transferases group 1